MNHTSRSPAVMDGCNRALRYLRVSVTDRCNLRCRYCMPPGGIPLAPHDEILTYEEIAAVARAAAALGVTSVRITGGEPLVRRDIVRLVALLRQIEGIADLSMTTNASLLAPLAAPLVQAGLARVNISLDTLNPREYAAITRGGDLGQALAGLEAALEAGLEPVKVNAVVWPPLDFASWALLGTGRDSPARPGRGDPEPGNGPQGQDALRRRVEAFVGMMQRLPVHVRFIEAMPVGCCDSAAGLAAQVLRIIGELGGVPAQTAVPGAGPARYWRLPGARGLVGLIAPMEQPFCERCNRLRLSARGEVRSCLFALPAAPLISLLRPTPDHDGLIQALRAAWVNKQQGRPDPSPAQPRERSRAAAAVASASMCQIGG